jgi:TRAP-type C4-dicarboxylate transport system permease small subunit
MKILKSLVTFIRLGETEISGWIVFVLTVMLTVDATLRYLFRESIPGGPGFSSSLLVIVIFFSLGQVQANKEHIRVEFLIAKLPPKARRYLEIMVHFFSCAFFLILFWKSIDFFIDSFKVREFWAGGLLRVPLYPAKFAMMMGLGVMVIELIKDIALIVKGKSSSESSRELTQSNTFKD